jgi:hypothetical protein
MSLQKNQPYGASPNGRGFVRRRRMIPPAAIACAALLLAGCGGSSSGNGIGPSPATFTAAAFKYASCIRVHGLSSFADPVMTDHDGQQVGYLATPGAVLASPAFKTANAACQSILSPTLDTTQSSASKAERDKHMVAFSTCMRTHGVSGFPDPTGQGQLSEQAITAAGVDLHAPAVLAAAKTCLPSADGTISAQQVERASEGEQ